MDFTHRRAAVVAHDLAMVALAWALALAVRYDFFLPDPSLPPLLEVLFIVLATQGAVLWWSGLYRGLWRFSNIQDLGNISRAAGLGLLAVGFALFLFNRFEGIPRSTLLVYPLFLVFLLAAPRLIYRAWKEREGARKRLPGGSKRVLVLGAGRAGEMLVRDMLRDSEYLPVGFLDDCRPLKGTRLHGVPVLGPIERLPQIARERGADLAVIAMPSATNGQMRRVVEICEEAGIAFRTLPRLTDMVCRVPSTKELREVYVDDLLGRDPVSLDWAAIGRGLTGRVILVTGGGGSIGAELCRQLARLGPSALVVFERSEYNLYALERELRRDFPDCHLCPCLGDICDSAAVNHVVARYKPDVIFHAAAYKHVPLLEGQFREAMRNNVIGTKVLAEAADRHRCKTFVLISTDKAVNPCSIMGASKRIAELYCQNFDSRSPTRFITVRFGNVLGSGGSVVPLFQRQIAEGGPVTVTHPQITRYFMTIPEACQLIMQSAVMGQGGEIFMLDMGEPLSITYLAEQMIRLSGKSLGKDIEIVYTGLRPGEKLAEELFHDDESLERTEHDKILLARGREVDWEALQVALKEMEEACSAYDDVRLRALLKRLMPETSEIKLDDNVVPLVRAHQTRPAKDLGLGR